MKAMVVQRFLGMDFTQYSNKHRSSDNVGADDPQRDCARLASKGLIERFGPFSHNPADDVRFERNGVIDAVKDLTKYLIEDVWPIATPDAPAGGNSLQQGTAAVNLDALVSEADLEAYIQQHIHGQAGDQGLGLNDDQKEIILRYRYAARDGSQRRNNAKDFYFQFSLDQDAFYDCSDAYADAPAEVAAKPKRKKKKTSCRCRTD
jgi:hypothetical protein